MLIRPRWLDGYEIGVGLIVESLFIYMQVTPKNVVQLEKVNKGDQHRAQP